MGRHRIHGVPRLTPEEVSFFKTHGYLHLPGVLDPAQVAAARALWWSHNPAPDIVREDEPETWLGGFDERVPQAIKDQNDESQVVDGERWRCRKVAGSETFLDLLPRACWAIAEQLCGEDTLIYPAGKTKPWVDLSKEGGGGTKATYKKRFGPANFAHPGANHRGIGSPGQACRGVYATMPRRMTDEERAARPPVGGGHIDSWDGDRWRFSVNTILDDVPPGGGAL